MKFRELLNPARQGRIPPSLVFRPTPVVTGAMLRVKTRLADRTSAVAAADLDQIERRLRQAAATSEWNRVTPRDWRHAPLCLWRGEQPYFAADGRFVPAFVAWFETTSSRRAVRGLIRVYLERFDPMLPGFVEIADTLQRMVGRWNWEWADRHKQHHLFDIRTGPGEVANSVMTSDNAPTEVLDGIGLEGSLATGRFAAEGFRIACRRTERDPDLASDLRHVDALIAWAASDTQLRYYTLLADLANALLLPWTNGATPPDDVKRRIQDFLLQRYGDPRLRAAGWNAVDDDAKRVMLTWLAKASLHQFLDVVDATAKAHQWEFRRAFWTAYDAGGHIAESWVVFARNPAAIARHLASEKDDASMRSFGEFQKSGGALPDHAVLLLKIGDLTIADWSHDGTCRIWSPGNGKAPVLYWHGNRGYSKFGLTEGSDFQKKHHGAWQVEVAKFIGRNAGVWVSERDYMPRGRRR